MAEEQKLDFDVYFFNLLMMFASAAWQQLGKTASPVDGKISKDIKGAQTTINMLLMLRDKTKGNLNKKEEEMLISTISDLQINFADEAAKPENKIEEKKEEHKHSKDCGCH
ncbi:DUF1844 domain-containing protein [Endomicrobium proavitum]|uniref:DUF1844 domain-containing protein n=1 Tax=Endomicrobium proavitum TaxID=1408281 RepID=A0A0G3WL78_9BACT|nr:DUF1844 domain-containing protein [Endomicrobium proavitum]AKL98617.1 hypothetical protein Epro_1238 [Endomicrobium proavitum]